MELTNIAHEIQRIIKELDKVRSVVRDRGQEASMAKSEYRKQLAITIIKLKNGESMELDGNKIQSPTATQTNDIARGICWEYKLKEDTTEKLYKSALVNLETLKTQLTAEQSLLKHLEIR